MVEQEHDALDKIMEKITDETLQEPLVEARGDSTIGERLAHIVSAEYRMATYLYQNEEDKEKLNVDPSSLNDIRTKSKLSKERHLLTLNNLSEDDLDKVWTSKVSGNSYDYKFLIWHFLEHIATHRGQVSMAINRLE